VPDLTPQDVLLISNGYKMARAVAAAAELDVGGALQSGPLSSADVATRLGTDPAATDRLLLALASEGVLAEPEPGVFGLGTGGVALLPEAEGGFRELILGWPGLDCVYDAFGPLAVAVRSGRPAFQERFGVGFFEHLAAHPELERRYQRAVGGHDVEEYESFVSAYDFSAHPRVVDLGGGSGGFLRTLLATAPAVSGCLFEAPTVAAATRRRFEELGVSDIDVVDGDLRVDQVPEADCFVMTTVLRYFDDGPARDLLGRIRTSRAPAGRRVLSEMPLPPGRAAAPSAVKSLTEWVLTGGRDRTVEQFSALFASAGLELIEATAYQDPYWLLVGAPAG
jgi:hypothetical protein